MNYIYHEKQEGSLCGQHCLNNLLQGEFFSAVELAEIAQQMDQEEQRHMAELGTHTEDFRNFLEQPSANMDDSGMFSVQVLTSALKIWDLSLVPFASSNPLAVIARANPVDQQAYICNFKEHWFTVRKLGCQWFNLNSLLTFPELISDTYLSLFLTQLQHEGYAIFVLEGSVPPSQADDELRIHPAVQTIKPQLLSEANDAQKAREDRDLKAALTASLARAGLDPGGCSSSGSQLQRTPSEDELKEAMRMSLEPQTEALSPGEETSEEDELQKAILLSLKNSESDACVGTSRTPSTDEAKDLEAALQMSLDSALCEIRASEGPLATDMAEMVRKRIEKFDKK